VMAEVKIRQMGDPHAAIQPLPSVAPSASSLDGAGARTRRAAGRILK
jgi:hypothetical protein